MPEPCLAMILKGWPRISETFISNEIGLLEELGLPIRIVSMRQPRESFSHQSVGRIRAEVVYLPERLLTGIFRLLPANAALAVAQPRRYWQGLALLADRLRDSKRPLAVLKHFLQAGYAVRRLGGAIHLHAHFAHSPASVAMFASVLSGLPFSFTAHAKDIWTQDPDRLAHKLSRAVFAATCTGANQRHLEGLAGLAGLGGQTPVHRVYHGIDVRLFTRAVSRPAAMPPFTILTVARLAPKKGVDTVIRALALLMARNLEFRYVLIGDGEERESIQALLRETGVAARTEWLGTRDHAEVQRRMEEAHVFVLGCRVAGNGDRDGIPNVLVEALAMEVPVVATRVSAIPEIVEHEDTGLLVQPDDPAALAAAVERMLSDTALRDRVAARGRDKVLREFDNRRLVRDLAGLFRRYAGLGPEQVN